MADKAQETIGEAIGRKLSVQSFGFDKPTIQALVLANRDAEHFLMRVVGQASGLKPYTDAKGETKFGLIGDFEATGSNGEVLGGSTLYLPGYVQDQIAAALDRNDGSMVEIAVDVYAQFEQDAATSYVFNVRNLIKRENPRIQALKDELKNVGLPQLPKPAK